MLVTALRARGLSVPAHHILDANVDAIMGNYRSALREAGHSFAQMADGVVQIAKTFPGSAPPSGS